MLAVPVTAEGETVPEPIGCVVCKIDEEDGVWGGKFFTHGYRRIHRGVERDT